VGEWLRARADTHAAAARAVGSEIQVRAASALQAHAPPRLLARVVDNLLGNALRHAKGPVELVAEADRDAAPGRVRIGVLDRGPGIPPEQLATAFRPFHRGAGSAEGGFGLGLAIVQQLAHANGWQVRLANRDGGGLEAWVTVPAAA
jgi:two-component system osmolarity sensor histidine kinase EnvZ